MVQVILTESAKDIIRQRQTSQIDQDQLIVISTDANSDSLTACFMEPRFLRLLKAKPIGKVISDQSFTNVDIYTFGVESMSADSRIELNFVPPRNIDETKADILNFQVNLSYARAESKRAG